MANNLTLSTNETHLEHSGDESEDDDDDVVEQSPCGRWEKRRQEVSSMPVWYQNWMEIRGISLSNNFPMTVVRQSHFKPRTS